METTERNYLFHFDLGKNTDLENILEWKYDQENFQKFIIDQPHSYDFFCVIRTNNYCIGHVFIKPAQNTYELDALELLEPFRGQGLGTELIRFSEIICQQKKIPELSIGAYTDEIHNISRYQKWGYKLTEKTGWCEAAQKKYVILVKKISLE